MEAGNGGNLGDTRIWRKQGEYNIDDLEPYDYSARPKPKCIKNGLHNNQPLKLSVR